MKKIIILGNSIAGVKAAEKIRSFEQESDITIFCTNGQLPFARPSLMDFLDKKIKEEEVYFRPAEFYQQNKINIIYGKKIARINLKKKIITTEEKDQFLYDILIVTEPQGIRFPEVKGVSKTGVFNLNRLDDIKNTMNLLPTIESVSMQVNDTGGLRAVCSFKKSRNKEVLFITGSEFVLSGILEKDAAEIIAKSLEENGIRVICNNSISEILGNGEVKAIRLESGKVFSSQIVILKEAKLDLRLFSDSDLKVNNGIIVDEYLKTNLEDVFAVDKVCEIESRESKEEYSIADLEEQGRIVGLNIKNQPTIFTQSLKAFSLNVFDLSIHIIGITKWQEGCKIFTQSDKGSKIYKDVFVKGGCVVGALLINCDSEKEKYSRLTQEKINISTLGGRILDADCSYDQIVQLTKGENGQINNLGKDEVAAAAQENPHNSENT